MIHNMNGRHKFVQISGEDCFLTTVFQSRHYFVTAVLSVQSTGLL